MPPIGQTPWQQQGNKSFLDLRVTVDHDEGDQITMTSLSDTDYEDSGQSPDQATSAFQSLIEQGQKQTTS